ncbi:uncharacterized protein LY89DRAFT_685683 [Mollisia scopiformis]|uniref:C2H2-type domain-containing protein n=1 Tax=Mollisia scopiformis TaxID=149040 RepID=A0A194X6D6_MOLSC|nr:uncharacterized protein LY89DRAFT_685683 [Mollisia scopiformis]KUJ15738.1 hypothetical protein LY89DRAFT_685683 [Mollisia scopiformis]
MYPQTTSQPPILPIIPQELEPFLLLLSDPAGLPICRICQAALLPKSTTDHLRKQHHLPASLRPSLRHLLSTLSPLEFSDIPPRPEDSCPVPELKIVDAFQCKRCDFIRRDLTDVRRHLNQEHGMSAKDGYEEIQAQSWFGGRWAVYWRVDVRKAELRMKGPPCIWGLFGAGWGDKKPTTWEKMEDEAMAYEDWEKKTSEAGC